MTDFLAAKEPACPRCGALIPPGGAGGMCPTCLLRAAARGLTELAVGAAQLAGAPERGDCIGPYMLREQLGEGGFGVVWRAEQERPVRREVAVKVMKPGVATKEAVARFDSERQALALMDHENIARVFDAGTAENGTPYFVMELVRGEPITEFCDRRKLSLEARLDLFLQVCRGVRHAHQKGIIHRDLKPSNVLVSDADGTPLAKVIDFGVARALEDTLTEQTLCTRHGQVIGTPQYMSPEQADGGGDVDTRSDVYSLGVLLYELLTGVTPLTEDTLRGAGYAEMLRRIREDEPPFPSRRITTLGQDAAAIADRRQLDAAALPGALRGDLDWIVMKALEKDRDRRFGSVEALAADLGRLLRHEPVRSRPPSAWYRLRKAMRRHRAATAAVLGIAASVLTALAVSLHQTRRAVKAEAETRKLLAMTESSRDAEHQARLTAESSAASIVELLARSTPWKKGRFAYADVLDKTLERLEADEGGDPLLSMRILDSLYQSNVELGRQPQRLRIARVGSRIGERLPPSLDRHDALFSAAYRFRAEGHGAESARVLNLIETDLAAGHPRRKGVSNRLWLARAWLAPFLTDAESAHACDMAWQTAQEECEDNRFNYLGSLAACATSRAVRGKIEESAALFEQLWREAGEMKNDGSMSEAASGLASLARHRGDAAAAAAWTDKGFQAITALKNPSSVPHYRMIDAQATEWLASGKVSEATALAAAFENDFRTAHGADEPSLFSAEMLRSSICLRAGQTEQALLSAEAAHKRTLANFGQSHEAHLGAVAAVARCLMKKGDKDAAQKVLGDAEPVLGSGEPSPRGRISLLMARAQFTRAFEHPLHAVKFADEAVRIADEAYGAPTLAALTVRRQAATYFATAEQSERAREMLRTVRSGYTRLLVPGDPAFAPLAEAEAEVGKGGVR